MSEFVFNEHFMPVANGVVFEDIKEFKSGDITESGLIIAEGASSTPEADTEANKEHLGVRVVAIGPDVTRVKVGDVIMIEPQRGVIGMELFAQKYYFAPDYAIMAILSESANTLHVNMKAEKDRIKRELAEAKRNKFYGISKDSKLDIN